MARNMDWVPTLEYGVSLVILPLETRAVWLYPPSEEATGLANDWYQFEENSWLFCERIVGEFIWEIVSVQDTNTYAMWRVMPLQADTSGSPDIPWDVAATSMFSDAEVANLRFWGERRYEWAAGEGTTSIDSFKDPFWSRCDMKPRQAFGQKENLFPALVLQNTSPNTDLRFSSYWRMLVKR